MRISDLVAAKVRARSNLTKTTSYSASLLEIGKPSWIARSSNSLVDDYRIMTTLELEALDALST